MAVGEKLVEGAAPAGRIRPDAHKVLVLAMVGLLVILVVVPLMAIAWISFLPGLPGQAGDSTLAHYVTVVTRQTLLEAAVNTVIFAVITTVVAIFFAISLAWLIERTDIPFKRSFLVLLTLGIVIPGFLKAMGWVFLLSPRIGMVNVYLRELLRLDITEGPLDIYNIPAMALVQGLALVPTAFFLLAAVMRAMDHTLEEAAYVGGLGKLRTLLRVNLPLSLPGAAAAVIFVFLISMSVFDVPAVIGLTRRIFVLSTAIYRLIYPADQLPAYGVAAAYGTLWMVAATGISYFYLRILRKAHRYQVITGAGYRQTQIELGAAKGPALAFVGLYFFLALVLPFAMLVWASLLPYFQPPSPEVFSKLSLKGYEEITSFVAPHHVWNTVYLVFSVPTATVVLSIIISWQVVRRGIRVGGVLDTLTFLPLATPHVIYAVGLLYLGLMSRNFFPIYGTIFIIFLAHLGAHISFGTRIMNAALVTIHRELEEAGRVGGLSAFTTVRRIVIPLVMPAIVNAWIWLALLSFRELTMAIMLMTGSANTVLSVMIWALWSTGDTAPAAAMGVVLLVIMLIFIALARLMGTKPLEVSRV